MKTMQLTPQTLNKHSLFFIINTFFVLLGNGGPLLLRFYFAHGGRRIWLSTLLQVCGWPLFLIPLTYKYIKHHFQLRNATVNSTEGFQHIPPLLGVVAFFLGFLFGVDSYLYGFGSSYLPFSTSSLLSCSQLAFTAVFAFLIVGERFSSYSVNAVVLLTFGPAVLSFGSSGDRPEGESVKKYYFGFVAMIGSSALMGLLMPLVELSCRKVSSERISYFMVMELQVVMGIAGTLFSIVGVIVNNDFQAMQREAKELGAGNEMKYYMVLIWDAIFWQIFSFGLVGIMSSASSFVGAVLIAILIPIGEILAVIFLHEKFTATKGFALALSLWGFISYLYGEMIQTKKSKQESQAEFTLTSPSII